MKSQTTKKKKKSNAMTFLMKELALRTIKSKAAHQKLLSKIHLNLVLEWETSNKLQAKEAAQSLNSIWIKVSNPAVEKHDQMVDFHHKTIQIEMDKKM